MGKLKLQVATPEKNFFEGEVDMIVVKSLTGEMGVLPKHVNLATVLDIGILKIKNGNDERRAAVNGGFMEILNNTVSIFTDSAEWPEEIDLERAEKAKEKAMCDIRACKDEDEHSNVELALKRAANRLQLRK